MPKPAIDRLQEYHDILKVHPYRSDFDPKYAGDYNQLMYELSVAWSDYIWNTPKSSEYEKEKFRLFGWWIHDFRQLLGYRANYFPRYFFNYYEQMLQVTHRFLETGDIDAFYNPEDVIDVATGNKLRVSMKYQFITSEICGVDSDILPCYLPIDYLYDIDQHTVISYFNSYWTYKNMSDEERNKLIDYWYKNTLPVLEWINSQCKTTDKILPLWKSIRTSQSRLNGLEEDDGKVKED